VNLLRPIFVVQFLLGCLLLPWPAAATVERYGIFIGSNRGKSDEVPLQFAETDAERLYGVLKDVGGFLPENMLLLKGETAATAQRALIHMNDRVRTAKSKPGTQVMLFVYYSGHADARSLHLGGTELELSLLEKLVRSSAAEFRILVVDACRAGALTRVKGGRPAPPFLVRVDEALSGEGTAFLTSTSASEDAQESTKLQGSFFTHYFRSGLLGPADADGDGQVTLDEAYRHAHGNTVRASSRTWAGPQHPTYHYELRGQGKLVLTRPATYAPSRAVLEFPPGADYLVLLGNEDGAVVAEVGARDKNRMLSVSPGRYFIRGRAPQFLLEGTVDAARGARTRVDPALLVRVDYARLARKGEGSRGAVHGSLGGYTVRTALKNTEGLCHGAFAGYAQALEHVTLSPRVGWCQSAFENAHLAATVQAFDFSARGSHAWDAGRLSFEIGATGGATLHEQRFAGAALAPRRTSWGPHFGLDLALSADLGFGVSLFSESGAEAHYFRLEESTTRQSRGEPSVALRQRFGLAKWF
jgi:hypothetical protein